MATTSNFDLTQTAFLFSWVANAADGTKDSKENLEALIKAALTDGGGANPNFQGLFANYGSELPGGDWEVAWGPAVYQNPDNQKFNPGAPQLADNAAYVVYSPSQDLYVVAVAGTNPNSGFDWSFEDLDVNAYVKLEGFDPSSATPPTPVEIGLTLDTFQDAEILAKLVATSKSTPYFSQGAAIGLWVLVSQLQDDTNTSLGSYLLTLANAPGTTSNTKVVFTGHSLGGALAPTLAYWFLGSGKFPATNVLALPVAGPTVGSVNYQEAWDESFQPVAAGSDAVPINPDNQVAKWNQNVICKQDAVPHAWTRLYDEKNVEDTCYFSDYTDSSSGCTSLLTPSHSLNSRMGIVCNCNSLFQTIWFSQVLGISAYGETATALRYTEDFSTLDVLSYVDGKQQTNPAQDAFTSPICSLNDFDAYESALKDVHAWSYGQTAFGIDITVFQTIGIG